MESVCFTAVAVIGIEIAADDALVRITIVPSRLPVSVGAYVIPTVRLLSAPIVTGKLNLLLTKAVVSMDASDSVMPVLPLFLIVKLRVIEEPTYTFPNLIAPGLT
jgi:hypothetical protein